MANAYEELTGTEAPIAEHLFEDIADDPNADDIARISPNGLMITTGTTDTTYSPDDPVIRAHMALFLTRLYERVAGSEAPAADTEFTDIAERNDEQQAAIGQLLGLGVTTGTTPTTYSPSDNVTREQMASFVARMYRVLDALAEAPGAPTGVEVAVSGDDGDALDVSWTAPEGDVTGYVVQWKSGDDDYSADNQSSVDDTSSNFADLTQGTAYTFRVAATNDGDQGDWSDEASGTPATVPGAVSDFTATENNESLDLAWELPEDDGGSPVTGYVIQWSQNRQAPETVEINDADATSYTIRDLSNYVGNTVWIQAVNAAGNGTPTFPGAGTAPGSGGSAGLVSPEPVAAGAPANLMATTLRNADQTLDPTMLAVSWSEPADSGGGNLRNFEVQLRCNCETNVAWDVIEVNNGDAVPYASTTRVYKMTIGDRTAGESCEIRVRANSWVDRISVDHDDDPDTDNVLVPETARNEGDPSGIEVYDDATDKILAGPWATVPATTAGPPEPPTSVEVTNAHQSLQVTWAAPLDNGGTPVTGYEITWDVDSTATVGPDVREYFITALDNRYNYTVIVKAVNAAGKSGDGTVITADFLSGTDDESLTEKPEAVNAVPSNIVAVPPPVIENVDHLGTVLEVSWNAPGSNGTNPTRGYVVEHRTSFIPANAGQALVPAGAWSTEGVGTVDIVNREVEITGLTEGTRYDVRVQAVNYPDLKKQDPATDTAGGPWATGQGTPATLPDQVVVTAGDDVEPGFSSVIVKWPAANSRGSSITHYLVRYALAAQGSQFSSDIRVDAGLTRHKISGLRTDTEYVVQVQAVNGIGKGLGSNEIEFETRAAASAPTTVVAVPIPSDPLPAFSSTDVTTTLAVSWSRVTQTNGGGDIEGYTIEYSPVGQSGYVPDADGWSAAGVVIPDPAKTEAVIAGLTPGTVYQVRVRAIALTETNVILPGTSAYAAVVQSLGVPVVGTEAGQHDLSPTVSINTDVSKTTLNVTWNSLCPAARSAITGYKVRWFPSVAGATGSIGSANVPGKETDKYAITGLAPGTYTVVVSVVNNIGSSSEVIAMSDDGNNGTQATIEVPK